MIQVEELLPMEMIEALEMCWRMAVGVTSYSAKTSFSPDLNSFKTCVGRMAFS
jgi:hypothetical protein